MSALELFKVLSGEADVEQGRSRFYAYCWG